MASSSKDQNSNIIATRCRLIIKGLAGRKEKGKAILFSNCLFFYQGDIRSRIRDTVSGKRGWSVSTGERRKTSGRFRCCGRQEAEDA
jgi:hypothetical protein